MRVLLGRSAALALCLCALPLAAQEDGSTDSVDLQEQLALDTNALAVLPIEILTSDPRAPALAAEAYEAILSGLASIDGLYVIGRESVLPYAGSALPAVEIARGLGVGSILESSIGVHPGGVFIDCEFIDAQTGETDRWRHEIEVNPGVQIHDPPVHIDLDALVPMMAADVSERVENQLFPERIPDPPDRQQIVAEAQAIVLDSSLTDRERLEALRRLWPYREGRQEALSGAVAVAAAEIANSDDPRVRAGVWSEMTGVGDPYLVQPLLDSLANDGDADVREEAAKALRTFLDEPGVREALEHAKNYDASETVRKESHFSMLSDDEQEQALRVIALDTSADDWERADALLELWYNKGFRPQALGDAVTTAMVELAVNSDDSRLRAHVWSLLSVESDPYLVAPLLSALVNDPDERGREAAASGLAQFLEHPGVREGLEEALVYDASLLVRKRAEESLESVNR